MMERAIRLVLVGVVAGALFLGLPPRAPAAEVLITSDAQFAFARQYLEKGDFQNAAAEFERFRYFFPADPRAEEALYLKGFCLMMQGRHDEARQTFALLLAAPKAPLAAKALFMTGESYYEQGLLEQARAVFEEVVQRYPALEIKNAALYRLGWTDLRADQWAKASEAFGRVAPDGAFNERSRILAEKSLEGEALALKDPAAAGVLALLPGAGHAYVGRYKDGLVALILNGLFVWAAIEAFDNDQNVLGGILAFLEVGWYSGNIYSAVNAAHKYNRKVKDDFRKGLDDRLDLRLFTGAGGQVGLKLSWRF